LLEILIPLCPSDISPYQGRSDILGAMTELSLPAREEMIYCY